uniref:Uncharacterized protein n=1 Tax=Solanum lycopersicum TaxID=4081 RepID=A0A3Q7FV95_SOLLC
MSDKNQLSEGEAATSELLPRSLLIREWKREDQMLVISVLLLVIAGAARKEKRMEGGAKDIAGCWCCCSLVFAGREKETTLPLAR